MKTGTKQLRVWDVTHSTGKTSSHPITRSAEHPLGQPLVFSRARIAKKDPEQNEKLPNEPISYSAFHIEHQILTKYPTVFDGENEPILSAFIAMNTPFAFAIDQTCSTTILINITTSKQATYNKRPSFRVLFPVDGGTERPLSFFHDRAVA
jgi:hypothetical protein